MPRGLSSRHVAFCRASAAFLPRFCRASDLFFQSLRVLFAKVFWLRSARPRRARPLPPGRRPGQTLATTHASFGESPRTARQRVPALTGRHPSRRICGSHHGEERRGRGPLLGGARRRSSFGGRREAVCRSTVMQTPRPALCMATCAAGRGNPTGLTLAAQGPQPLFSCARDGFTQPPPSHFKTMHGAPMPLCTSLTSCARVGLWVLQLLRRRTNAAWLPPNGKPFLHGRDWKGDHGWDG